MFLSFSDLVKNEYKKLIFIFTIFILFLISAFRNGVGLDEDAYRNIYNLISADILNKNFSLFDYLQEPLFILINKILLPFKSDQSIFIFFSIINATLLYLAYKRFVGYAALPILIYFSHRFLHNDLNQIRQGLISLIFLYSLNFMNSKKFYIYNLIGLFVQSGAIIYFAFNFVKKYFTRPKHVFISLLISFFLTKFIAGDSTFGFLPDASKIFFYLKDERFNYTRDLLKDFTFYKCMFILFLMSIKYSSLSKMWIHFPLLYSTYAFGIFCLISFHNIALISGRVSTLLFTVEPILIYYVVKNYTTHINLYASYLLVILFCFATLYLNLNSENSPVTTYKSIFIK
jgi:hypothetical protein